MVPDVYKVSCVVSLLGRYKAKTATKKNSNNETTMKNKRTYKIRFSIWTSPFSSGARLLENCRPRWMYIYSPCKTYRTLHFWKSVDGMYDMYIHYANGDRVLAFIRYKNEVLQDPFSFPFALYVIKFFLSLPLSCYIDTEADIVGISYSSLELVEHRMGRLGFLSLLPT